VALDPGAKRFPGRGGQIPFGRPLGVASVKTRMGKKLNLGMIENKALMNQMFGGNETGHGTQAGHRKEGTKRRVLALRHETQAPDADRPEMLKGSPHHGQTGLVQNAFTLHGYPSSVRFLYRVTFPSTTFAT
jgi:hypothetical protein